MPITIKNLDNKDIKVINTVYSELLYYIDCTSQAYLYKRSLKLFKQDRDLNSLEVKLLILNNLLDYELHLKNKTLDTVLYLDIGMIGIFKAFERCRSCKNFESLLNNLKQLSAIYTKFIG